MPDYEGGYTNEPLEGMSKLTIDPAQLETFHQRRRDEATVREMSRQMHMQQGACPHEYPPADVARTENPHLGTWTEDSSKTCVRCGQTVDLGRRFNNWSGD